MWNSMDKVPLGWTGVHRTKREGGLRERSGAAREAPSSLGPLRRDSLVG